MAARSATQRRFFVALGLSIALFVLAMLLCPLIGSVTLNLRDAINGVSPDAEIFFQARLPRVLLAAIAGGALAVAGVLFQALLRNPLADPYTLGISSGASLGAVLAIVLGVQGLWNLPGVWLFAFSGAILTLLLVLGVGSSGGRLSPYTLLLTGVSINAICIAAVLFLQNFSDFAQSFAIVRWLMGGVESLSYGELGSLFVVVMTLVLASFTQARQWNLLAVGELWGASRGVAVQRVLWTGYLCGSLLTGAVTALAGPIGFVGLIVPHAVRLLTGPDHRLLLPCSFFVGAAFLAICDTVARTLLSPADIPVGVITALAGGPFFVLLLKRRQQRL